MAWVWLTIASLLEVVWSVGLKQSAGFSRFWPSLVTVVAALGSFWLLAVAMRSLPLGTAYAAWVSIGAVGAFLVGALWLGESLAWPRVLSVALLLAGVIGLKLSSGASGA